jgi:hypothetical protein
MLRLRRAASLDDFTRVFTIGMNLQFKVGLDCFGVGVVLLLALEIWA